MFWIYGFGKQLALNAIYHSLSTGIIIITIAFFLLEHISQKKLAPHFFPNGGLHAIPKTLRIHIRTRLVALLFACNLIPLFSIILIIQNVTGNYSDSSEALERLRSALITNAVGFVIIGIYLTGLVSRNLALPFAEIIQTLRGVRNGQFDKRVRVTSNDEIGYTGDVINEMTEGSGNVTACASPWVWPWMSSSIFCRARTPESKAWKLPEKVFTAMKPAGIILIIWKSEKMVRVKSKLLSAMYPTTAFLRPY